MREYKTIFFDHDRQEKNEHRKIFNDILRTFIDVHVKGVIFSKNGLVCNSDKLIYTKCKRYELG